MTKNCHSLICIHFILGILLLSCTVGLASTCALSITVGASSTVVTDGGYGYEAFPDITRLQDGRLMAVFYEGYSHISLPNASYPYGGRIMAVTSSDEGVTWGSPSVVCDSPVDDRDPQITQLSDGRLLSTFFLYNSSYQVLGVYYVESNDGGVTWSAPQMLAPAPYAVSSPVRQLSSGRLIEGLYYSIGQQCGAVILSDDNGYTWSSPIDIPNNTGLLLDAETDVIELADGSLWAAERSSNNLLHYATSIDEGQTWSESLPLDFRADAPYLLRVQDDIILMGYRGYNDYGVQYTALRYSLNEAATWSSPITIDSVNGAYVSMVELNDGSVLAVYYEEGAGSDICARVITITPITVVPNTTPLFDSMESYTTGEGMLVDGSYDWFKGLNGSSPGASSNSAALDIVTGGISSAARCAGNSTHTNTWTGSALEFEPISRGTVDVSVLVYAGYASRFVIYVQGDGLMGSADGYVWLQLYPDAYDRTYSRLRGLGHDISSEGDDIDGFGWVEVDINMDFDNSTIVTRWRDVDDSTGGSLGDWHVMQSANVLPFLAFDYVELTGLTWSEHQYFDNLTVTHTPPAIPTTCAEAIAAGYGLAGDFNDDCRINLLDLAMLAENWLRCIDPTDNSCERPWWE
ncbi:MAG: exo-alpha-sialidase [Sedimentisphaerales bacterium]|nr:exo-alpha-sialidase [Sedimentisphaerales bacterium]